MKRVNLRYPLLIACAFAVGAATGLAFVRYRIDAFWLTAAIPCCAVPALLALLFRKNFTAVLPILLTLVFFLIGAIDCNYHASRYDRVEITDGRIYALTGVVCDKGRSDFGEYVLLKNVTADGNRLYGKTRVTLKEQYGEFCDVGYTVQCDAALYAYDLFAYGDLTYQATTDVKYRAAVYGELVSDYGFSLFGSVRSAVKSALYQNLSPDTAAVVCAMLLGDTDGVEEGTLQTLRYGGIAHVFAISGLHIGIVYGALYFLTKKLRLGKTVSAILCLGGIFFYAGVCGFTLSSLRAALMCAVSAVAQLFGRKYDGMNALAVAAAILIALKPFSLFSTGFQLSVCAVGGIHLLTAKVAKPLRKLKVPEQVATAAGTTLGAQMGTVPVMLARFGYLSGAGLLLNFVLVPLLSLLFIFLFAGVILSVLLPMIAATVMPAAALPLEAVLSFLVNAGFENALITGFGAGWFLPVFFVLLILISDKLNLRRLRRVVALICTVAVLFCYTLVKTYFPLSGVQIIVSAKNGEAVLFKTPTGTVLVVTEDADEGILATLNDYYASRLQGAVILGGEDCALLYPSLGLACDGYVCSLSPNVQPGGGVVHYVQQFELCGIQFEFADGYSLYAQAEELRLGICAGEQLLGIDCDLLISHDESPRFDGQTVYFSLRGSAVNAYDDGDLLFYLRNGNLTRCGGAER